MENTYVMEAGRMRQCENIASDLHLSLAEAGMRARFVNLLGQIKVYTVKDLALCTCQQLLDAGIMLWETDEMRRLLKLYSLDFAEAEPRDVMEYGVCEIGLPDDVRGRLEGNEIRTVCQLVDLNNIKLYQLGFRAHDITQITKALNQYGLALRNEYMGWNGKPRVKPENKFKDQWQPHGLCTSGNILKMKMPTEAERAKAKQKLGSQFKHFEKLRLGNAAERLRAKNILVYEYQFHANMFLKRYLRFRGLSIRRLKNQNSMLEYADLFQEVSIAILYALERFDYALGFKFETYLDQWLRQAIDRAVHEHGCLLRIDFTALEKYSKVRVAYYELYRMSQARPTFNDVCRELDEEFCEKESELIKDIFVTMQAEVVCISDDKGEYVDHFELMDMYKHSSFLSDANQMSQAKYAYSVHIRSEVIEYIRKQISKAPLKKNCRYVLIRHYGLDGKSNEKFGVLALPIGLTGSRAHQLKNQALKILRRNVVWDEELLSCHFGKDAWSQIKKSTTILGRTLEDEDQ
ncbi:sigma factor [Patescibacteria group bacterium]